MRRGRAVGRFAASAVRSEGGILPAELLERLAAGDKTLPGLAPADYHLGEHERLGEAVNRAWSRLLGAWQSFRNVLASTPAGDAATGPTRERWLLPLFQELGYGRLLRTPAVELDGKSFAVSHGWHHSPIHLLGARVSLDHRAAGVAGAAMASPHGLVQELLNRSPTALWGFVSNGLSLRVLRDHHSLTRQAYVELDLEAIFDGELYEEFLLLWLVCHQSRVEAEKPEECWLERWFQRSREEGIRALDRLRGGVEAAIAALGAGFLRHRANRRLQDALESGKLDPQEYYRQLLRLVYRLIFLFVAEDREALLDPAAPEEARSRFARFYASRHLRRLADRLRGGAHGDLWQGLRLVMAGLDGGCPELGLPALGSFLWSPRAIGVLGEAELANSDLLSAVRALCTIEDGASRYPVSWRSIGSEELGSIYESLLELHPRLNREAGTFELATAAGHERKTTGSYYTPSALVDCLLDSALDPVLAKAAARPNAEQAILALKVCDPACGSGHFLVAAGRRIAKRLAAVRSGDDEPSPQALQEALRDVVGHCLYGVDVNPMAVELCKVSLWMEAIEPGKPLSFLDHHIQVGNSLLGATPALLERGIPDAAFQPLEGDDKKFCAELRKVNKRERETRQLSLFDTRGEPWMRIGDLASGLLDLDEIADDTAAGVRRKEARWQELLGSQGYEASRLWADAWCAAFVWEKVDDPERPHPITEREFRMIEKNPFQVSPQVRQEIRRLAEEYQFFHWHLAFPGVFRVALGEGMEENGSVTGWDGGFDVVLGNPPWDKLKLHEKEFFAARAPEIAEAENAAARQRKISALAARDAGLHAEFLAACRRADGQSFLVRGSGRYPLCGRGDVNTYSIFAELNRALISRTGRVGCIVPTGIATDDTTKLFFQDLLESGSLYSLYDFQSGPSLFAEIGHARFKFCLLTMLGSSAATSRDAEFAFFLRDVAHLGDEERRFRLSATDVALLNPNTRTCPIFRNRRDAEITKAIYRRVPVLINDEPKPENPWSVRFLAMFHMSNDSGLFRTREQLAIAGWKLKGNRFVSGEETYLPLYEAKMIHHFDHRFGDYQDRLAGSESTALPEVPVSRLEAPTYSPLARYWVPATEVEERLRDRWDRGWLLGWRDITNPTNERTVIASVIPRFAVGNKFPLILIDSTRAASSRLLQANLSAFVYDYSARQKMGGTTLNYFIFKQLAVLPPEAYEEQAPWDRFDSAANWIGARALELTYTAWDLQSFAKDCGYDGSPFRWDEDRRFLLRCELDAAFFHLCGIERDDVDYIMETFPIVKREDVKKHGDYRTKLKILEIYDEMQRAIETGKPYETLLDPPPADPRLAHPQKPRPWVAPDFIPTLPSVPEWVPPMPTPNPQLDPFYFIWSAIHVRGGRIGWTELARAFSLYAQPELMIRSAPKDLAARASEWARRIGSRSLPDGAYHEVIGQLSSRNGISRTTSADGVSLVEASQHTPAEEKLDKWFQFEACLALAINDALPRTEQVSPDEHFGREVEEKDAIGGTR